MNQKEELLNKINNVSKNIMHLPNFISSKYQLFQYTVQPDNKPTSNKWFFLSFSKHKGTNNI